MILRKRKFCIKGTIQVIDRYSGGYAEIDILSGDIILHLQTFFAGGCKFFW